MREKTQSPLTQRTRSAISRNICVKILHYGRVVREPAYAAKAGEFAHIYVL
jgi:hypothetical protein